MQGKSLYVEVKLRGETVRGEIPHPGRFSRLTTALPLLQQIDDQAIGIAARAVEATGKAVSCRKGCSACCRRQPVPIAPVEALAIAEIVEEMPEPRRADVRARFAANVEALREAGLLDVMADPNRDLTREEAADTARRYMALGLVCPFLEDDACGIYPDRPFVCRQYLVTSPAEWCTAPLDHPVEVVPVLLAPTSTVMKVSEELLGRRQMSVPLTLALLAAERDRALVDVDYDTDRLFNALLTRLFGAVG